MTRYGMSDNRKNPYQVTKCKRERILVLLEENKLLPEYKTRVEDEINYYIDEAASKIKQTRIDESVNCILKDIGTKYNKDTKFLDITDEDDIYAIHHVRYEAEVVSPFIKQLKIESIKLRLQELSDQLSTEGNNFIPKARSYKFLRAYQYLPDRDIQTYAKRLQKTLDTLFLACMEKKYSLDTHINFIAPYEKDALQSIRPRNPHDSTIDPIILSLYWQKQEKDIDFEIENLQITGRSYSIPQGRYKWLKYNCSAKVPYNVQMKAKRYIDNLDKTFGKGNYSA
ncbi:uncharacterized protein LOC134700592 [Mytilus trossulus]|uniref:uncharacterized protein LOC134700592 n=1 Tax=Mytilus trossulus TaxID=6551 RepID=UPI0030074E7A